jgi:hypothetical protein
VFSPGFCPASPCAKTAGQHHKTKSATALNLTSLTALFIFPALHLVILSLTSVPSFSTAQVKPTAESQQDMGSTVHKSGIRRRAGQERRSRRRSMKSGTWRYSCRRSRPPGPAPAVPLEYSTKVDLHVRYITCTSSGGRCDFAVSGSRSSAPRPAPMSDQSAAASTLFGNPIPSPLSARIEQSQESPASFSQREWHLRPAAAPENCLSRIEKRPEIL